MLQNYSGDEGFALFVGGIAGGLSWFYWYYLLAVTGRQVRTRGQRWPLALAPLLCAGLLFVVLQRWSAEDVRTDNAYMFFYMVIGTAWMGVFRLLMPLFGLNARDDVLERGNAATGWASVGALVGGTCCFAGANVGNGPGWWVVLFSAGLSTGALLVLWWLGNLGSGLAEKVSVERDLAAGLRAAGLFVGMGLVLGRAVAGDWVSAAAATADFARMAWPVLVLAGAATALEHFCPPNMSRGWLASLAAGGLPALVYVAAGVLAMLAR